MSDDEAPEQEEPNPVRRLLDLFVFAPVGVAVTVLEDLPALIAKGQNHISNARVVGQFVVTQGQREVTERVTKLLHGDVTNLAEDADGADPVADPPPASATAPPAASPQPAADPEDGAIVERALEGYDTLSASQVVRRLESLGPEELRAVHRHEASHRNRRTILNRTNQLLDGPVGDGAVGH